MDYCIIDGYNVLNLWPELQIKMKNLSEARAALISLIAEYSGYEKKHTIIVFDALFTTDDRHKETIHQYLEIVFTQKGETADSHIEKMVYDAVRNGNRVEVVTSDYAEQNMVLGSGGCRISALEFRKHIMKTRKTLEKKYLSGRESFGFMRNEIGSRLDSDMAAKLNELRQQKVKGEKQKKSAKP